MKDGRIIGGILLIAGTAIGAGMLAMPISTGILGFKYAALVMIVTFFYMLSCLFLMLEANSYCSQPGANIISMSKEFFGKFGQAVSWLAFLLLLYNASAAYISGGGSLLLSNAYLASHFDHKTTCLIFTLIFGVIGFLGVRYIDIINRLFMIGLIASYITLVCTVSPLVKPENLLGGSPKYLWAAIPILVLSFTSHIILPSLRQYCNDDIKKLKKILIFGSIIPLIVYLIWEFLLLGMLPKSGAASLEVIARAAEPITVLNKILQQKNISGIANANAAFSFFALVTSFLGVILSLSDFISDGFKIPNNIKGRILNILISFTPPLAFAMFFPESFIVALSYAGILVAILYCLIPACIVWKARYVSKLENKLYIWPFGKFGLVLIFTFAILIIVLQILATNNLIPKV